MNAGIFLVGDYDSIAQKYHSEYIANTSIQERIDAAKADNNKALVRALTFASKLPRTISNSDCNANMAVLDTEGLFPSISVMDYSNRDGNRYAVEADYKCAATIDEQVKTKQPYSSIGLTAEFCGQDGQDIGGCSRSTVNFTAHVYRKEVNDYKTLTFMGRNGAYNMVRQGWPAENRGHTMYGDSLDTMGASEAERLVIEMASTALQQDPSILDELYAPKRDVKTYSGTIIAGLNPEALAQK